MAYVGEAIISCLDLSGVHRAASGPRRSSGVAAVLLARWRSRGEVGERRVRNALVMFRAM
jgi:hypothetical protein